MAGRPYSTARFSAAEPQRSPICCCCFFETRNGNRFFCFGAPPMREHRSSGADSVERDRAALLLPVAVSPGVWCRVGTSCAVVVGLFAPLVAGVGHFREGHPGCFFSVFVGACHGHVGCFPWVNRSSLRIAREKEQKNAVVQELPCFAIGARSLSPAAPAAPAPCRAGETANDPRSRGHLGDSPRGRRAFRHGHRQQHRHGRGLR